MKKKRRIYAVVGAFQPAVESNIDYMCVFFAVLCSLLIEDLALRCSTCISVLTAVGCFDFQNDDNYVVFGVNFLVSCFFGWIFNMEESATTHTRSALAFKLLWWTITLTPTTDLCLRFERVLWLLSKSFLYRKSAVVFYDVLILIKKNTIWKIEVRVLCIIMY